MNSYDVTVNNNTGTGTVDVKIVINKKLSDVEIAQISRMRLSEVQRLFKGHVFVI